MQGNMEFNIKCALFWFHVPVMGALFFIHQVLTYCLLTVGVTLKTITLFGVMNSSTSGKKWAYLVS